MCDRRGVTLIELVMSAVVGGLLLGIAMTALAPARSAYSVRAARSTFATLVAHARARAVEEGREVLFRFDPVGDSAWFQADSGVWENVRFRESMDVDLVGDAATVCVSARGIADPACGTLLGSARLSFEKGGRTATATLLLYGQFLETHSAPEGLWTSRGGFTLVELIVAVVLLSIGILALAGSRVLLTRQATIAADAYDVEIPGITLGTAVRVGAPLRSFRHETLRLAQAEGAWFLSRSHPMGPEPLVGPLSSPTDGGLQIQYLDSLGISVADAWVVDQIVITARTDSQVLDISRTPLSDSARVRISLKN